MRFPAVFALTALAVTIAGAAVSDNFKQIRKENDFLAAVEGKRLTADWGWVTISADGTMTGKHNTQGKIRAAWNWQGRWWCRNLVIGSNPAETNCQKIELSGNQIRFIRDKGKGRTSPMTIGASS